MAARPAGPSGLLVNPARLRLPQLGQPPIDTPHGAAAERDGLKLHEYPVQNCPKLSIKADASRLPGFLAVERARGLVR